MKAKYGSTTIDLEAKGTLTTNTTGTGSTTLSEQAQWDELEAVMDTLWGLQAGRNLISAVSGAGKALTILRCSGTSLNDIKTTYATARSAQTKAANFLYGYRHSGSFAQYHAFLYYIKRAFAASSYSAAGLVGEFTNRPSPWSWSHHVSGNALVTAVSELLGVSIPASPSSSQKAAINSKLQPFWGTETTAASVGGRRLFNLGIDFQIALADHIATSPGSTATIEFDPVFAASSAFSVPGSSENKRAIILGHELIHVLRGMRGEVTYGPFSSGNFTFDLEDAYVVGLTNTTYTYTENQLRSGLSVAARTAI